MGNSVSEENLKTILAFGASNSRNSINVRLATFAVERFQNKFGIPCLVSSPNIHKFEMPIYSVDREQKGGIPQHAFQMFELIGAADGLIISFPEYNGTVTSAWKNIHDWVSRIKMKIYQDKPAVILSASPGKRGGAGVLNYIELTAPFFGMDVCGRVEVGNWYSDEMVDDQAIAEHVDMNALDAALSSLADKIR